MEFRFDEKVDSALRKSLRAAIRTFREQQETSLQTGTHEPPPSYQTFRALVGTLIEANKENELSRLRSPDLRELYEKTWSQKLRRYTAQRQVHESYESLLRRFK